MKNRHHTRFALVVKLLAPVAMLTILPSQAFAQVPVDDDGEPLGQFETVYSTAPAAGNEEIPTLSATELEELVGPIALYPDDLLAIVLPAAAYPLQIVDAARFLAALEIDPALKPDPDWDDAVVALLNYPEVVELLNDDIDWTWRLGEAVVAQQADVVAAVETFRDRAYAAGNLKSDSYQNVSNDEGVIEITPVSEDVIYVPYYEPERVVVYQPRPAYYYYPRPYPVYYYPYSSSYAFDRGYFWGVTTAFSIGWYTDRLNVFHHSYYGHPYYGRSYFDRWWYRRPTLGIHNTNYVHNTTRITINRYDGGDHWRPRHDRRDYVGERRITRNRENPRRRTDNAGRSSQHAASNARQTTPRNAQRNIDTRRDIKRAPIAFRERPRNARMNRSAPNGDNQGASRSLRRDPDSALQERPDKQRGQSLQRKDLRSERRDLRVAPAAKPGPAKRSTSINRSRPTREAAGSTSTVERRRQDVVRRDRSVQAVTPARRAEPARRTTSAAPARRSNTASSSSARSEPQQRQRKEQSSASRSSAKPARASKSSQRSKRRQ
ncbi:MAG: DUF3300 domain-containing protein [Woeseiaceae bacterium]|nr:DUF3300 domain-containing protein [Woeseiaceae bacterium]